MGTNETKANVLYGLLCKIEEVRATGGPWGTLTYNATRLYPKTDQEKIKAFVKRKQRENGDVLLKAAEGVGEYIKKMNEELNKAATEKKADKLTSEIQRIQGMGAAVQQFTNISAQLEVGVAAQLLDYLWQLLDEGE